MTDIHHFWMLPPEEQEAIRQHSCFTEEEYQAFLDVLFPAHSSVEDANAVYDLSEIQGREHPQ